jgi:hypothetical protein
MYVWSIERVINEHCIREHGLRDWQDNYRRAMGLVSWPSAKITPVDSTIQSVQLRFSLKSSKIHICECTRLYFWRLRPIAIVTVTFWNCRHSQQYFVSNVFIFLILSTTCFCPYEPSSGGICNQSIIASYYAFNGSIVLVRLYSYNIYLRFCVICLLANPPLLVFSWIWGVSMN